jgi:hypothetical protein
VRTVLELRRCSSPPRWNTEVGRVGRADHATRLKRASHSPSMRVSLRARDVCPGSSGEIRAERLVETHPMPQRMRAVGGARMDDNGRQLIRDRSMPLREGASLRKQVS